VAVDPGKVPPDPPGYRKTQREGDGRVMVMGLELLGRKLGMSQIFTESGERVPVAVIQAGPCTVVQKGEPGSDGSCAVQIGFEERKEKHTTRPLLGHFKKAGVTPKRVLYEIRMTPEEAEGLEVGQELGLEGRFEEGQRVDVTGQTKGRGFSGVIKRWNYSAQGRSHGTHEAFRHGGAISAGTYPGRILKGKKMPGQYGNERVTTLNLRVERIDPENGLIYVRGAVPGHNNSIVRIRNAVRDSKKS
jgi:large subunit ribosomal protein L3